MREKSYFAKKNFHPRSGWRFFLFFFKKTKNMCFFKKNAIKNAKKNKARFLREKWPKSTPSKIGSQKMVIFWQIFFLPPKISFFEGFREKIHFFYFNQINSNEKFSLENLY